MMRFKNSKMVLLNSNNSFKINPIISDDEIIIPLDYAHSEALKEAIFSQKDSEIIEINITINCNKWQSKLDNTPRINHRIK